MNCIILGSDSDIAKGLQPHLKADGWKVYGWKRNQYLPDRCKGVSWDLVIVAIGRIKPVGFWTDNYNMLDWIRTLESNLLLPLGLLENIWPQRAQGASICFLAGSNPNTIMDGYGAYNVSKMAMLKLMEQLDHETPDAKFFALGPGTILTKIHKQSEGWHNPKLAAAQAANEDPQVKIRQVYECLQWCIAQPKNVIGGRNICVSDQRDESLSLRLSVDPDLFKLRRRER
jgi:NAD(P)-dependent dehydrogenase (short-subunit alcohol dehydrogenase family)